MPSLNLDTLRSLDAKKTYYISNSTGQIKEAGRWQKFKTLLGIGDGRDKVQKLLDEVKVALLAASGETDNAKLSAEIKKYDDDHNWHCSLSGRSLSAIANRFAVANADKIASTSAREISEKQITALVKDTVRPCLRREDWPDDAVAYLERAAKPLVDHPPMKDADGGRRVLDEEAFNKQLKDLLDAASTDLVHIATDARLGMPRFDKAYLDHVFSTLYDENGVRNEKTTADLRPASDIRFEVGRKAAGNCPPQFEEASYSALVRTAIDACGKDTDVLYRVLSIMRRILVNDGGQVRTPEAVRQYVDGIRANFAELREVAKGNKNILRNGLEALREMTGKPLSPGLITKIAQFTSTLDLDHVGKLSPSSEGYDIHMAMRQLQDAFRRMLFELRLVTQVDGQDDLVQARLIANGLMLGRFPLETLRRINAALETPQAARVQQFYYGIATGTETPDVAGTFPIGVQTMISGRGANMANTIDTTKNALDTMLGMPPKPIDSSKAKSVSYRSIDGDKIFSDIKDDVEAEAKAERKTYLAQQAVKGNGLAATRVRGLISNLLDEAPFKPEEFMRKRFTNNIRPLLSLAALNDAKKVAQGVLKDTGFAKAIADGTLEVEIKGGGKLSSDPDEALDQLAQHVTDRKDATFATIDPLARRKVAIIAGLLGDKTAQAISDGVGLALDPEGGKSALTLSGGGTVKRRITLDYDINKRLQLNIDAERTGGIVRMGSESFRLEPGSVVKTHFTVNIDTPSMEKLEQNIDLDAFDGTAAEAIASAPGSVPDRSERVKESLGADHMIGGLVTAAKVDFILD